MKLLLLGGFLGSGKTTAIAAAARLMIGEGKKIAVITNDQGDQQVDAQFLQGLGISTKEVSNGCFCCHFDELSNQIKLLEKAQQPDFIFAESVGSCTDLIATVAKPLIDQETGLDILISVFADARILLSILTGQQTLNEEVLYVYKKQLEESDLLVISKVDLLSEGQLKELKKLTKSIFEHKKIIFQNSLDDSEVQSWIEIAYSFKAPFYRHSLDIDYDMYAMGEAGLAWLDKGIEIHQADGKAIEIADKIIHNIHNEIMAQSLTIGHLKFYVESEKWKRKISFTIAGRGSLIEWDYHPSEVIRMLINARVQTTPEILTKIIKKVLFAVTTQNICKIEENKWSSFRPGYPKPTHRMTT